jgi:hypothetical protein
MFSFGNYCLGSEMKKDEMDGTCGTHGEEERCIQGFGGRGEIRARNNRRDWT